MLAPCQENQKTMEEYHFQMDLLIEHMFPANEFSKKPPSSWLKKMTNLVGGTEYQHAHSDQERANAFSQKTTYPFVAMHGFGVNSFEMWLLPQNLKHGFLHKFKPRSLLLMRGDFVHAGGTSKLPRCHMDFSRYPLQVWCMTTPITTGLNLISNAILMSGRVMKTIPDLRHCSCYREPISLLLTLSPRMRKIIRNGCELF